MPRFNQIFALLLVLVNILNFLSSINSIRYPNRIYTKFNWELDSDEMRKQNEDKFPIKSDKLIQLAKNCLDKHFDNDTLADDFIFQCPIIGPINKTEYLNTFFRLKIKETFPDLTSGAHDFRIDPFEPNRVWWTNAFQGTHTGNNKIGGKPTNTIVIAPPQANSFVFNEQGKVILHTGGYVMDKRIGNTGGVGGIFGPFRAIGKSFPFPEGKWKLNVLNN